MGKLTHYDHELAQIMKQMQQKRQATQDLVNKGKELMSCLDIKDRKWHFKVYRQCFVGSEAVETMIQFKFASTKVEAIDFGNRLLKFGIIEHVEKDHSMKQFPQSPEYNIKANIKANSNSFLFYSYSFLIAIAFNYVSGDILLYYILFFFS